MGRNTVFSLIFKLTQSFFFFEHQSNRFEKLRFKVNKDITIPMDAVIVPVNPVATVYGKYRNNLSIKWDNV